jgi:hypothetical protein
METKLQSSMPHLSKYIFFKLKTILFYKDFTRSTFATINSKWCCDCPLNCILPNGITAEVYSQPYRKNNKSVNHVLETLPQICHFAEFLSTLKTILNTLRDE